MAKSSSSAKPNSPYAALENRPLWLPALICFVPCVLLAVGMAFFEPLQVPDNTTNPLKDNPVGDFGVYSTYYGYMALGWAAWFVPFFLGWLSYVYLRGVRRLNLTRMVVMVLCIGTATVLLTLAERSFKISINADLFPGGIGGYSGRALYTNLFEPLLGPFGTGFLLDAVFIFSLLFVLTRDVGAELDRVISGIRNWRANRETRAKEKAERHTAALAQKKAEEDKRKTDAARAALTPPTPPAAAGAGPKGKIVIPKTDEDPLKKPVAAPPPSRPVPIPAPPPPAPAEPPPAPRIVRAGQGTTPPFEPAATTATPPPGTVTIVKPEEVKKAAAPIVPAVEANYEFPPVKLLREPQRPDFDNDEEHTRNMADLVRILGEFGVAVNPGEIHIGPVITCYEVVPAPGVRVEKIAGLDKNIALGMRAQSVRILAPIPGKAAVGVEIPNRTPTPVGMREILESEDWASTKSDIPIALGKDVSGRPLISDLAKMPHLLIAGATGSGKSVCINSIIASIVFRKSPRDLQLIMVDPKVVELKVFNTLPHMLIPVVTEPKKVPGALKWLLSEMEQRYQIFAKVGVRNIHGFNSRKKPAAGAPPAAPDPLSGSLPGLEADDGIEVPERLPYIVAIIDELADLMMVAPAEIETSIARLAQLARAAGIHLIIATQRPSVNVITGVIKANLPSRIAFQVASQVDSRTILDTKGADTLIGRGDMLFSPPGTSRLVRAQGAFVSDEEVQEFVTFLQRNGPPKYRMEVQEQIDRDPEAEDEGADVVDPDAADDETLLKQAVGVLKSSRRASTSMLQRRLRIGYNRAARIMDLMEEKGIVGPENGSSPRDILVDLDSYQP